MSDINFALHPAQREIFDSKARFQVAACGRRFGKSYLACVKMLVEACKDTNEYGYPLKGKDIFYVAPTFQQAKDILWSLLKELGHQIIAQAYENTAVVRLINGRRIHLKGSDRPDTLRGVGLSYAVLDEYASMKPETWEQILRPTLADVKGGALFIGTPAGKNHFYELYLSAQQEKDWESFTYTSVDNPYLDPDELAQASKDMSKEAYRQEFEASFAQGGGIIFDENLFVIGDNTADGNTFMAVDPAGFQEVEEARGSKFTRLDETAIAVADVGPSGWYVHDVITGRWDIRRTSLEVLRACQKYRPLVVGIERSALMHALMPYLNDQMMRLGIYPNVQSVSHGGTKKVARITWALQGRLQNGRITFAEGDYFNKLVNQAVDFPNKFAHDDMLDSLAYIDQVQSVIYSDLMSMDTFKPLDAISGF